MRKCELFPVLDKQSKRLNQLKGLSNLLMIAGGLSDHSKSDLCECLSIISDIASETISNQQTITDSVTQLSLVNDCVNGLART